MSACFCASGSGSLAYGKSMERVSIIFKGGSYIWFFMVMGNIWVGTSARSRESDSLCKRTLFNFPTDNK